MKNYIIKIIIDFGNSAPKFYSFRGDQKYL